MMPAGAEVVEIMVVEDMEEVVGDGVVVVCADDVVVPVTFSRDSITSSIARTPL
jgi:hypothetical protein